MDGKDRFPVKWYDEKREKSIEITLVFDQVYRKWMQKILSFVKKVSIERDSYDKDMWDKPEYSFFGTSEAVADQFFYCLMKDELSESNENFALEILCKYITEKDGYINKVEFLENLTYMSNLCTQEFNNLISGEFYDFYISMWSCFESAINSLCVPFEDEIKKKLDNSNYKKTLKFIKKCIENEDDAESISKKFEERKEEFIKKFPKYVSFPDKINYLFSNVLKSYSRDINKDKEILLFCGKLRNTLHNNGLNSGGNQELEVCGYIFKLENRKKIYSEEYINKIILINEIFDIYSEIMKSWNRDFPNK